MFCHDCGKELPDGAKFCTYCGSKMPDPGPRHARPEPEEIYSYSDADEYTGMDVNPIGIDQQDTRDFADRTKVYDFALFEEPVQPEPEPFDDREIIDDSFDNYTEEEALYPDDPALDYADDRRKKRNTWLWIVLGAVAAILVIVIGFLIVNALTNHNNKNNQPTAAPTAATQATQKPTEKPTEAPRPTQAPQTEAPAPTELPAPTEPPATEPAPAPTDPQPAPTTPPETLAPEPETASDYAY